MKNVGIIGCGAIFPLHKDALLNTDNVKITAVCDIDKNVAEKAGKSIGCRIYTDYQEMIEKENLDAVHILTPHYLHAPMTIFAAEHGINVLTEKPMATN